MYPLFKSTLALLAFMVFAANATAQGQRPTLNPGPGLDAVQAQITLQTQLVAAQTQYLDDARKIAETPDFLACRASDRVACARMNVRLVEIQNALSRAEDTSESAYRLAIANAELQIASLAEPRDREIQNLTVTLISAYAVAMSSAIARDAQKQATDLEAQLSRLGRIDPVIVDLLEGQLVASANLRTRTAAIREMSSLFGTARP